MPYSSGSGFDNYFNIANDFAEIEIKENTDKTNCYIQQINGTSGASIRVFTNRKLIIKNYNKSVYFNPFNTPSASTFQTPFNETTVFKTALASLVLFCFIRAFAFSIRPSS